MNNDQEDQSTSALLFASPSEATKKLQEEFDYWGGRVTGNSYELSLAVVAANWAAFGSWDVIKNNLYAQTSLIFVIFGMAVSLLGARWMSELYRKRLEYAEHNHLRWQIEYQNSAQSSDPWPFTNSIENLGYCMRLIKVYAPFIGGVFFILALFF